MNATFTEKQISWAKLKDQNSTSKYSSITLNAYKYSWLRKLVFCVVLQLEGGPFFSCTTRRILLDYHGVTVGAYSYGSCLVPGLLPRGTIVGSYCSFADGLRVFRRNHALHTLCQHPFFYNKTLGLLPSDTIENNESNPLVVGNDVWIGESVLILPGCRFIGDGAVVGAGSVVTRSVEPYTVVAGNPAKIVKHRYEVDIVDMLRKSKWWELSLPELLSAGSLLISPITQELLRDFVITRGLNKS